MNNGDTDKKIEQERSRRAKQLLRELKKIFPAGRTDLHYSTPWELLVAVILSAQCTDKRVNSVTKNLFIKYPTLNDYLNVDINEFEQDIYSTGFYRAKARHILGAAQAIHERFHGAVPQTMTELITLPGVGRKTANVVLSNAFDKTEGIAVDTHVRRFAIRYNLTDFSDPKRIEQDLMRLFPKELWNDVTYYIIQYGRVMAPAHPHDTSEDPLVKLYPPAKNFFPKAK